MAYYQRDLEQFATEVLTSAGLSMDRSKLVARILVCSDMMGHTTHGLQLLWPYAEQIREGKMTLTGEPEVIADHGSSLTWDGNYLPGPYLVEKAIDICLTRMAEQSMVTVAIGNSHHIACLAAYMERVTAQGYMIIIMSSDPGNQTVAPFGGLDGKFSPDPIAYGIPTEGDPIIFDSSASLIANGVVMQKRAAGKKLSGPWLMDAQGNATDDPEAFFADPPATILPAGGLQMGFKGFGYAILIEALTSGLAGKGRKDENTHWRASVMVQVINPDKFGGRDNFRGEMQNLVKLCRASNPRPGFEGVRMPGERALKLKREYSEYGVAMHPEVIKTMEKCAEKYQVDMVQGI